MSAIDTLDYTPFTSAVRPPTLWNRCCTWLGLGSAEEAADETEPDSANYSVCDPEDRLRVYKQLLEHVHSIYVFRHGTAVHSAEALSAPEAVQTLKQHGPVQWGTPSGDFWIASIQSPVGGFVVRYSHPQILSFAGNEEYPPDFPVPLAGSMIRLSREMDSRDLCIVAQHQRGR
ncbi:hypothetical protein OAH18_01210 [bacterium]|nr:hypothetical protein [bacterium]